MRDTRAENRLHSSVTVGLEVWLPRIVSEIGRSVATGCKAYFVLWSVGYFHTYTERNKHYANCRKSVL